MAEGLAFRGLGGYLVAAFRWSQCGGRDVLGEDVRQTPTRDVQGDQGPGVCHGCSDFPLVADDPGISHQPGDILLAKTRHSFRVETDEGSPERFTFAQDGDPFQPRLEAFQYEAFEQQRFLRVIGQRTPPLGVMVVLIQGIPCPETTLHVSSSDRSLTDNHGRLGAGSFGNTTPPRDCGKPKDRFFPLDLRTGPGSGPFPGWSSGRARLTLNQD